jgi:ferric-dicitrate binding protein FerR (iron transport regulator)
LGVFGKIAVLLQEQRVPFILLRRKNQTMPDTKIFNVIARVLNGSASLLDHQDLAQWRSASDSNEQTFASMRQYWKLKNPRELNETEKSRVNGLLRYAEESFQLRKPEPRNKLNIRKILRYAALLAAVIGFGLLIKILFTPDPSAEIKTSEIFVTRGSRAQITLPDNSVVWIGNESRLSYPNKFSGSYREVTFSGEAFFDVTSDKNHPFLVHTSGPIIRVTGTEFYVHDYPDDPSMETSLISGGIDLVVDDRILSTMQAGTRLIYLKETGKLISGAFDEEFYEFWKKGEYSFVDKPFSEIASMMRRVYNVDIVIKDNELKEKRFTGSIGRDDNVYTLLEVFKQSSSTPFDYTMDNNWIYIKRK